MIIQLDDVTRLVKSGCSWSKEVYTVYKTGTESWVKEGDYYRPWKFIGSEPTFPTLDIPFGDYDFECLGKSFKTSVAKSKDNPNPLRTIIYETDNYPRTVESLLQYIVFDVVDPSKETLTPQQYFDRAVEVANKAVADVKITVKPKPNSADNIESEEE